MTTRGRVFVLVGIATATRLMYLFGATDPGEVRSDAFHYHEIASNLVAGRGFSSSFPQLVVHATAFRPPVYPAMLGALYVVTGPSVVAGKLLNIAIGVAVVVLAARLMGRVVSPAAGWATGVILAAYPPLIANDVNLLTEPLSLLIMVMLATEVSGRARWWLLGLETAALALTRPSAQLFAVLVGVFVLRRVGMLRMAAFAAVVVLVMSPWSFRNHSQLDTWNLNTSNGFNLAAMYSEPAQDRHSFVDPVQDPWFGQFRLSQFDEGAWDAEMTRIGVAGLRRNPGYFVFNVARNTAAVFELSPGLNAPAEGLDGRNMFVRSVSLPLFYTVTLLGAWGIARTRRTSAVAFLGVGGVYFVVASLVFVAAPRLRAPFDLACCAGAGIVVAGWRQRRSVKSSRAVHASANTERTEIDG